MRFSVWIPQTTYGLAMAAFAAVAIAAALMYLFFGGLPPDDRQPEQP